MRMILWGIVLLLIVIIVYFFILGMRSKEGTAPGLVNGQLSQCGPKPNCVCSEQQAKDDFYIEALKLPEGSTAEPLAKVKAVVQQMGGEIVTETDRYLAAEFSSKLFGFVDDFEVRLDDNQLLQVRSASRVGHSDMGANRKRVEELRTLLKAEET